MGAVAVVIGIFFVVGLFVGAVTVIALPALKDRRPGRGPRRRDHGDGPDRSPHDRVNTEATRWEDAEDQDRPRWPGDSDSGYSGL
jgi:hypothetical protein